MDAPVVQLVQLSRSIRGIGVSAPPPPGLTLMSCAVEGLRWTRPRQHPVARPRTRCQPSRSCMWTSLVEFAQEWGPPPVLRRSRRDYPPLGPVAWGRGAVIHRVPAPTVPRCAASESHQPLSLGDFENGAARKVLGRKQLQGPQRALLPHDCPLSRSTWMIPA